MRAVLKKIKFDSIQFFLSLIFGLILFPSLAKTYVIFILGVVSIVKIIKLKTNFNYKFFLLNGSVYFFLFLTFFYSENKKNAFFLLQTMSSLVVFPLIFSILSKKDIRKSYGNLPIFLLIYIVSVNLFNIVPFLWYLVTQDTLLEILTHYPRAIIIDFGRYTIHPIYISMHSCIAILFSIYLIKKTDIKKLRYTLYILIVFLSIFLFIYAKKGPLISLVLVLIFWFFLDHHFKFKRVVFFVSSLVILIVIVPNTNKSFLELINIEQATSSLNASSTNIRYTIYGNSIELIKKSPILGYGIGDANIELKKTYSENAIFLLDKEYNSHNQYLSFLLIGGFVLLLIFILIYFNNIIIAIKTENTLLFVILCFYGIMMLFENILEREHGVIFFTFFINFFALKNFKSLEE